MGVRVLRGVQVLMVLEELARPVGACPAGTVGLSRCSFILPACVTPDAAGSPRGEGDPMETPQICFNQGNSWSPFLQGTEPWRIDRTGGLSFLPRGGGEVSGGWSSRGLSCRLAAPGRSLLRRPVGSSELLGAGRWPRPRPRPLWEAPLPA